MSDAIIIHGALFHCHIGVGEAERTKLQPIILDVRLSFNTHPSAVSGDLAHTIDFAQVLAALSTHIVGKSFVLIETLAEEVAQLLFSQFPTEEATVVVKKPQALDLGSPEAWAGIEITRRR